MKGKKIRKGVKAREKFLVKWIGKYYMFSDFKIRGTEKENNMRRTVQWESIFLTCSQYVADSNSIFSNS